MIYEPSSQKKLFSKSLYYNKNDEILYYRISDDNTLTTTYFDPNDKIIEDFFAFSISDLNLFETYGSIKSTLLAQAREKYSID
ncbi:hypothetical protein [Acinetobacter silvestris]|uniref:Uncharacterized protein n=1 Tax=Acinetobacter silvestris TaxID=1977882 RepID=A0A1Y3CL99_9GAMM|nr:hypothetical protein [Acinetobacter silvestris]OTG66669.1 hypothetical protein B9T28_05335 [Acinetobacter silvestris]